jgi:hypothetical protein
LSQPLGKASGVRRQAGQRRHVSKRRRRQRWIESIVLFIPAIVPAAGTARTLISRLFRDKLGRPPDLPRLWHRLGPREGYAVVGRCCHRRPAMLTPPGRNSVVLQQIARRPQRPESSAAAAGAGGDWGIVWLAVGDAWVVRLGARTEPTNAPAVEADDATSGGGTHGQGASATGRTAGSGWGCRRCAGHSVRRGRIRCRSACPRTNDGRTASDHHDE